MKYALGNMLNGAGGLNADQLALDLQFAADKTLTARKGPTPVFTRASSGTFVGNDGLIQSAGNNVARFDHDPVTPASRGLLIEESRTNLTWPSIYTTSNLGVGVFPTGSTTISFNQSSIGTDSSGAALFRETATTQVHGVFTGASRSSIPASISIVSGTVYTASIFVKGDGRTKCRFSFNTGSNNDGIFATFDISSTGSIITNSTTYGSGASAAGLSASIIKHIDGWFRISVSGSLTSSGGFITVETLDDSGNRSYLGDTSKGLFIANAQLEAGSFPTSHIPTTTGTVIRSADVCSITGAAFSGMWNASEGTLYAAYNRPTINQLGAILTADVGSDIAKIQLAFRNTNQADCSIKDPINGATFEYLPNNVYVNGINKHALGYLENNSAGSVNNAFSGTDTTVTISSLNTLTIGSDNVGNGRRMNGTIAAIRYYRKRLANAKLQALTA